MVTLDFENKTLGDALTALAGRSGVKIVLGDSALAGRRVTLRASEPLPFWLALDQLARAAHVRHDPGSQPQRRVENSQAALIRLIDGDPPAFTTYFGPLRIHLFASHRHRDVNFAIVQGRQGAQKSASVTVEIQAFAEPGRFINPNGPPRIEAVDGAGRVIARQPAAAAAQPDPFPRARLIPGRLSLLQWHVPLGLPDQGIGSTIKLRGVLPVVITARMLDPLVIPLAGAAGKTFRQGTRSVRITAAVNRNAQMKTVDFFLNEDAASGDSAGLAAGTQKDYIGDYLRDRIEFIDPQGVAMTWDLPFPDPIPDRNGERRIHIQTLVNGALPPAQMRIYRLSRLAIEIPFEFNDVPSP